MRNGFLSVNRSKAHHWILNQGCRGRVIFFEFVMKMGVDFRVNSFLGSVSAFDVVDWLLRFNDEASSSFRRYLWRYSSLSILKRRPFIQIAGGDASSELRGDFAAFFKNNRRQRSQKLLKHIFVFLPIDCLFEFHFCSMLCLLKFVVFSRTPFFWLSSRLDRV